MAMLYQQNAPFVPYQPQRPAGSEVDPKNYVPPGYIVYPDHFRYMGVVKSCRSTLPLEKTVSSSASSRRNQGVDNDRYQRVFRKLMSEDDPLTTFSRLKLRQMIISLLLNDRSFSNGASINNLWGACRRKFHMDYISEDDYGVQQLADVFQFFEMDLGLDNKTAYLVNKNRQRYPEICVLYSQPNGCYNEDSCPFLHLSRNARPVCLFHALKIGCQLGADRCPMQHDDLTSSSRKRSSRFDDSASQLKASAASGAESSRSGGGAKSSRLGSGPTVNPTPTVGPGSSGGTEVDTNRLESVYRQLEDLRELLVHFRFYGSAVRGDFVEHPAILFDRVMAEHEIHFEVAQRTSEPGARRQDVQCDLFVFVQPCIFLCTGSGFTVMEAIERCKASAVQVLLRPFLSVSFLPPTTNAALTYKTDLMVEGFDEPPTGKTSLSSAVDTLIPDNMLLLLDADPRVTVCQTLSVFRVLAESAKRSAQVPTSSRSSYRKSDEHSRGEFEAEFLILEKPLCTAVGSSPYQSQSWMGRLVLNAIQQRRWSVLLYDENGRSAWNELPDTDQLLRMIAGFGSKSSLDKPLRKRGLTFVPPGLDVFSLSSIFPSPT